MENIVIADLKEEDLKKIQKIYSYFVLNSTATFEEEPPSVEEIKNRWLTIKEKKLPYVTAKINGEVVGYAYATTYRPRSAYRFVVESSVYVKPEFAGMGIAKKAMDEIIRDCRAKGYKQILAVIAGADNIASRRFHKKLGFVEKGILEEFGFKFDKWLDTVLMQLKL